MTDLPPKRCGKCLKFYPSNLEYFHRLSSSKDGLQSWCRQCQNAYSKQANAKRRENPQLRAKINERSKVASANRYHRRRQEIKTDADLEAILATMPPLKRCSKCGEEKPRTPEYFSLQYKTKDALHSQCRVCANESSLNWARNNPAKANALTTGRYAVKLQANPMARGKPESKKWRTIENAKIDAIYQEGTDTGKVVDHLIPLKAKEETFPWLLELKANARSFPDFQALHPKFKLRWSLVCGLHVSTNLQVIEPTANVRKGNQFMSYRENLEGIYVLSKDGKDWIPIKPGELDRYPWIKAQL